MILKNVLYFLTAILTGGSLFAWYNVYLEYVGICKSCSVGVTSIFFSKCFIGAFFFTFALTTSVYALSFVK